MKTQSKIIVNKSDFELETIIDESPDLSGIGEYSDKWKEGAIDRKERGDMNRHEYRYFIPANEEYVEQDYQRMESYNQGQWQMIGIRAAVRIQIPQERYTIGQTIHSPGLWGIESDSGDEYFQEVFADESAVLAEMLEAMAGIEVRD